MTASIEVVDRGRRITFGFDDILSYHGHGSPGGAALGFKVLERALPLLDPDGPCERREIVVETAFGGPGARDAVELVTRAVSGDRFRLDPALDALKLELAERVMARPAGEVYDEG